MNSLSNSESARSPSRSRRLLLWRWSEAFDSPAKRKKAKLKFRDITAQFAALGHHPAIGAADISGFRMALEAEFGKDEERRAFVFEQYPNCAVVQYSESVRISLVPRIAAVGKRFGLNASEFWQ